MTLLKNMTAASRISFGLVCSMIGLLITSSFVGLLPDQNVEITQGRAQLTESLAFSTSVLLTNNDRSGIEMILQNIVDRQKQVLGIGVRRTDGTLVIAAGDHIHHWPSELGDESNNRFMQVPLSQADGYIWGKLEVSFTPLDSGRWYSFFENPQMKLISFVAFFGFFSFRLFLKFVLKSLDPSRAVPRRVLEALDILNEGLMIVSVDDRILLANNALARTAKRSADSLIGRKAGEMKLKRTDDKTEMPWTECGATSQPVSGVTMEFVDPQRNRQIFKVNCSPLFGNEGTIRGVMVSLDDVTQLEKNKIDLRVAKDEADAANKAKGDFLANMSHEIRNPMNAIVGFTDILRRGLEDSEATRTTYLDTIHASGTHLVELINDILDFPKIEAGKLDLEIRECSPYQLMNEVVNVLRINAEQQSLGLSIQVNGTIPETIHADSTRLRQILMNLVGNAIKFTADGSVTIVASMLHNDGKPFIRFEVRDTGIGMTKEQMSRLFQEFMQADSSVTHTLGLANFDQQRAGNRNFLDELLNELPGVPVELRDAELNMSGLVNRNVAPKIRRPIHSTLPMEIPEFREIVESFVGIIADTMRDLRVAQSNMDYQEIREVAHRLKGTGGTVGFNSFTEPSCKLQLAAEERDDHTIDAMLAELEEISGWIELQPEPASV